MFILFSTVTFRSVKKEKINEWTDAILLFLLKNAEKI